MLSWTKINKVYKNKENNKEINVFKNQYVLIYSPGHVSL
jgi:hypothetical protein